MSEDRQLGLEGVVTIYTVHVYIYSRAKYRTDRQQGLEGVVTIYTVHVYIYIE